MKYTKDNAGIEKHRIPLVPLFISTEHSTLGEYSRSHQCKAEPQLLVSWAAKPGAKPDGMFATLLDRRKSTVPAQHMYRIALCIIQAGHGPPWSGLACFVNVLFWESS